MKIDLVCVNGPSTHFVYGLSNHSPFFLALSNVAIKEGKSTRSLLDFFQRSGPCKEDHPVCSLGVCNPSNGC